MFRFLGLFFALLATCGGILTVNKLGIVGFAFIHLLDFHTAVDFNTFGPPVTGAQLIV